MLPESPRWLMLKGKLGAAKRVLCYAASVNEKTILLKQWPGDTLWAEVPPERTSEEEAPPHPCPGTSAGPRPLTLSSRLKGMVFSFTLAA